MLFFTGMGGIALSLSGLQGDALSYKKAVMNNAIDGIVLFSGGLDSILASRVLMEQGLSVRCLHFLCLPFSVRSIPLSAGNASTVSTWSSLTRRSPLWIW